VLLLPNNTKIPLNSVYKNEAVLTINIVGDLNVFKNVTEPYEKETTYWVK